MLYFDQPVQVGLSYDTLANISVNLVTGDIVLLNDTAPPEQNATYLTGIYPSEVLNQRTAGSRTSAIALWQLCSDMVPGVPVLLAQRQTYLHFNRIVWWSLRPCFHVVLRRGE